MKIKVDAVTPADGRPPYVRVEFDKCQMVNKSPKTYRLEAKQSAQLREQLEQAERTIAILEGLRLASVLGSEAVE